MDNTINLIQCDIDEPMLWAWLEYDYDSAYVFPYVNAKHTAISIKTYDDGFDNTDFYFREDVYDEILKELNEFEKGECLITYEDDYCPKRVFSKEDSQVLISLTKQTPDWVNDAIYKAVLNSRITEFSRYSLNGTFEEYLMDWSIRFDDSGYYLHDGVNVHKASGRAEEILKEIVESSDMYVKY